MLRWPNAFFSSSAIRECHLVGILQPSKPVLPLLPVSYLLHAVVPFLLICTFPSSPRVDKPLRRTIFFQLNVNAAGSSSTHAASYTLKEAPRPASGARITIAGILLEHSADDTACPHIAELLRAIPSRHLFPPSRRWAHFISTLHPVPPQLYPASPSSPSLLGSVGLERASIHPSFRQRCSHARVVPTTKHEPLIQRYDRPIRSPSFVSTAPVHRPFLSFYPTSLFL